MNTAIIGVGSNIDPEYWIAVARVQIEQQQLLVKESLWVMTKPIGFHEQDDFMNGAWLIQTKMNRTELVEWLHQVENKCGRIRTENKNGPRTLDLDVLVWNGEVVDEDVHERSYLRDQVNELWPDLQSMRG